MGLLVNLSRNQDSRDGLTGMFGVMADSGGEDGGPALLVVVVDINPNQVSQVTSNDLNSFPFQLLFARKPNSLSQLLNCVLCLINSHLMLEPRCLKTHTLSGDLFYHVGVGAAQN